ncbi:MAG TPA: ABC transporter ATP-binding protein [Limnobacter sp.]|nr:ABC transporter ATP-binding protein [Limnobacter sp.]
MALQASFQQTRPMPLQGSFSCRAGEMLALVGPSGAGKSSILRLLAGLMNTAQGRVEVGGQVWMDTARGCFTPPQQRRVGMVFQDYALMPHLSALDNVALALLHLPRTERRALALQWLQKVRLSDEEILRKPAGLSGGQQQRVALARALARKPDLLLLDEPFSAVDQVNREGLYRLLADLRTGLHIPIVMVTHDLNEARQLCDKLVVLDHGRVLQEGEPFEVHRRPRNSRVADLVGIQNRFQGVWLGRGKQAGFGELAWVLDEAAASQPPENGLVLQVKDKGKIPTGFPVNWVVHPDGLALKPADYTQQQAGFALLPVHVQNHRDLGELSWLDLTMDIAPHAHFKIAVSGAQRLALKNGEACKVEMELALIHIMPNKASRGALPPA